MAKQLLSQAAEVAHMQSCDPGVKAFILLYNCGLQSPVHHSRKRSKDGPAQERQQPEVAVEKSKSGASVPRDAFVKCLISADVSWLQYCGHVCLGQD